MPIFDMILSRPLLSADRTLATAAVSLTPRMRSARTRSSADSMSRYGLTAEAPKDTSVAAWWTSRTSPASTTMLTRVRVRSRTRWWCSAEVSRSEGIGARSAVDSRSLRTMKITPDSTAALASAHRASMLRAMASGPALTEYSPDRVTAGRGLSAPRCSPRMWAIAASSSLSMTGRSSMMCAESGRSCSRRLPSRPIPAAMDVTICSRIESSGGFVTCAKFWWK